MVFWGHGPRSYALGCPCLAAGITATPALGCAPGRATGTQLQMTVLKAWAEEEESFSAVLVSVLSSELKSDGYLGEGFKLNIGPLKSFSFPPAFVLKYFCSLACSQSFFPFLVSLSLRGKKIQVPKHKPTTTTN